MNVIKSIRVMAGVFRYTTCKVRKFAGMFTFHYYKTEATMFLLEDYIFVLASVNIIPTNLIVTEFAL